VLSNIYQRPKGPFSLNSDPTSTDLQIWTVADSEAFENLSAALG